MYTGSIMDDGLSDSALFKRASEEIDGQAWRKPLEEEKKKISRTVVCAPQGDEGTLDVYETNVTVTGSSGFSSGEGHVSKTGSTGSSNVQVTDID